MGEPARRHKLTALFALRRGLVMSAVETAKYCIYDDYIKYSFNAGLGFDGETVNNHKCN